MTETQVQVSIPANAATVAGALKELTLNIIKNHKAGGGIAVEVTADVVEALKQLSGALGAFSGLGEEAKAEPIGFAEAFVLAGFTIARELTDK